MSTHTPPCDCGYKCCDGTTQLNGVRFTCSEGQYTYAHHIDDWPIYAAAPELLEALIKADLQIEYMQKKFKETGTGNAVRAQIQNVLRKAKGTVPRSDEEKSNV